MSFTQGKSKSRPQGESLAIALNIKNKNKKKKMADGGKVDKFQDVKAVSDAEMKEDQATENMKKRDRMSYKDAGIAYGKKDPNQDPANLAHGGVAREYGAGPEQDRNPGTPAKKPDDTRIPKDDFMSKNWSEGNPPARKPDDERRPKSAYLDTNDWSDGEEPSRKPFADGGLIDKPNAPRPSQQSTETTTLNSRAPRQGSTPEQMAEYHEQEGARYRMMAQGGVAEVDGLAEEDAYMGTPPRKPDDHRFPEDEYMSTDKWSKGNPPARKPDDERPTDGEMESDYFADGGMAEGHYPTVSDAIMADKKRKKFADGGMVDLDENAREEPNNEDDMSYEALKKENYSEDAGLEQMGSPMDSNQKGRKLPGEDEHDKAESFRSDVDYDERGADDTDMLNSIMRKMKAKRG